MRPPLTFGGVADYALALEHRAVRHLVPWALGCGLLIMFAIRSAWVPTIEEAFAHLPERAEIRRGRLFWPATNPTVLANNHALSIIVNPGESTTIDRTSDVQIEFGPTEIRCRSFLGWLYIPYPSGLEGITGRSLVLPWWGAWKPMILAGVAGLIAVGLLGSWAVVGLIYTMPASLLMGLLGKTRSFPETWRLTTVALLPASVFMVLTILAYAWERMNILVLSVMWGLHWVVGWAYVMGAILALKRRVPYQAPVQTSFEGVGGTPATGGDSPFAPPVPPPNPFQEKPSVTEAQGGETANPFRAPSR